MERYVGLADVETWIDSLSDRDLVKSDSVHRLIAREAYLAGAAKAEWAVVRELRARQRRRMRMALRRPGRCWTGQRRGGAEG